ncbi:MAG: hypothetical protein D6808_01730 [Candidatus Dadabacteria bacterium]|nr:MAG: hypothetical protein D6808_01730 [Candidatus Dadabacteria bacterium]
MPSHKINPRNFLPYSLIFDDHIQDGAYYNNKAITTALNTFHLSPSVVVSNTPEGRQPNCFGGCEGGQRIGEKTKR